MGPIFILYLEDSPIDMELSLSLLRTAGISYEVRRVQTEEEFVSALQNNDFDLILADWALPDFDGQTALSLAQDYSPDIPFVFVSGTIGEELAIDSLQRGATDYVLKQRLGRLAPAVRRALAEAEERKCRRKAEKERADLLVSEKLARREAETRAEQLAQLNGQLEQFAYAASHDLQEPLRMVKIYAQMLARRSRSSLDEAGLEFIKNIELGVARMENLIQDLLSYSTAVHDSERDFQVVALDSVLCQTLENFRQTLEEVGAVLTSDPLPVVLGNPDRIAQVFQNLISNSLKYRHAESPRIHVSATAHGDWWNVCVKDNGIGFNQEYAHQIFGLFKRLHRDSYPGTGVGLALAKQIVEQHGGRIWAEGKLGEGAVFCFTLPAAVEAA